MADVRSTSPVACKCPFATGQIQTSCHAGGIASD